MSGLPLIGVCESCARMGRVREVDVAGDPFRVCAGCAEVWPYSLEATP